MNNISTITQLLNLSNLQFRVFDIGRKIEKISKKQFEKIELNQIPYPTPSQGHAFISIAFWQKETSQPYLWLLKLPLDEQGLLNQGARNHFIAIITEALGSDLTKDPSEKQEELLKNNPYIFTPAQYKLAALNSKIKVELKHPASKYFTIFKHYLSGDLGWKNWSNIGIQGITDFAARIRQSDHSQLLQQALPHLPEAVLQPLCTALENESFDINLTHSLLTLLETELKVENPRIEIQQVLLRSFSSNTKNKYVIERINNILQQANVSAELLITLSGRCWFSLENRQNLMAFLEHLVQTNDMALFKVVFKDLVAIPSLRPIVFLCMRSPNRSKALIEAIGQLFN